MKNKTVKMVLAVVVLGVCCGAYAGVKTYVAHQEQKESEEDSEEIRLLWTVQHLLLHLSIQTEFWRT